MNLTYTARASHAPNRVVRPRSLSTRALGRAHVHAKAARTDVGRSPRAIDSHARVGVPRSLARTYLEARGDAAGLLAVRCRSPCAPSVPLVSSYLSLSLPRAPCSSAATAWLAGSRPVSQLALVHARALRLQHTLRCTHTGCTVTISCALTRGNSSCRDSLSLTLRGYRANCIGAII